MTERGSGGADSASPERPPFKPNVQVLHVRARRLINAGPYESYEVTTGLDARPDPTRSVSENLALYQAVVIQEVDAVAAMIRSNLEVEKNT